MFTTTVVEDNLVEAATAAVGKAHCFLPSSVEFAYHIKRDTSC